VTVTVYHIGPDCVQCNQTKSLMKKLSIEFDEVDLRDHPELADKFKKQGLLSAPVVVAGSKTWAGFKFDKIHALANRPKEVKNESAPFNCHGIEWEAEQSCLGCDAVKEDREKLIKVLTPIRQRNMGKGLEEEIVADTLWQVIELLKRDNK